MPQTAENFRFLLVLMDTSPGWIEAVPARTEETSDVTCMLLKEIIPRFGLPNTLQSDNGPTFASQITQQVSKSLGIHWILHSPWILPSTGKTEKMNHTLKKTIAKICQEAQLTWDKALSLALLRVRVAP